MTNRNRREFLADVGQGMLLASVGAALAADLGLAPAFAKDVPEALTFGDREPLVSLMQETPADKLLPILVEKLNGGTELEDAGGRRRPGQRPHLRRTGLRRLSRLHGPAAGVPDGARTAQGSRALPVLKVLYRNAASCRPSAATAMRCCTRSWRPSCRGIVRPARSSATTTRKPDIKAAEGTFAALAHGSADDAFNDLQFSVQDEMNVHRVVLVWRSWAMLDLAGKEQAHTLLRQSVRFCCNEGNRGQPEIYTLLPKLLDQYKLLGKAIGKRKAEDAWVAKLAETIYGGGRAKAADAVAAALAEGMSPEAIGEAISLAANRLVLCDPGRTKAEDGKPIGSVHGASVGVHASDSANAWRNIARVSNPRNTFASLIGGAYHTAGQNGGQLKEPHPPPEQLEKITAKDGETLLKETEAAIKEKDQARAAALVHATASKNCRSGRSSTCCCATPSARTERCTRRSTIAP